MGKLIYNAAMDPLWCDGYIDVDKQQFRTLPGGEEIPFRYVHGGFRGTDVKFLFCFPEKEAFQGRFYQYLSPFPGPDEELASLDKSGEDDKIAFCLMHGAYFVESNMGSAHAFGPKKDSTLCWKASAAAAEFSRKTAMEYYGCGRPNGYVFGGSGGGYKTMACIENTNAWEGAAPYVIGSPASLPNTICMHVQSQRALRRVFPQIIDALDAGGSGEPTAGMTQDEASIYREIVRMGTPPKSWFLEAEGVINDGALPVLYPNVKAKDPDYFRDFWTVPGYLGADPSSSAARDRLQFSGVVKQVHVPGTGLTDNGGGNSVDDAWRKMLTNGRDGWIELEEVPTGDDLYLQGVTITITSGAAEGKQMLLGELHPAPSGRGGVLTIGMCFGMADLAEVVGSIHPGDTLTLDNSDYIAIQSYYRHQVPADLSFRAWDQFRGSDGQPTLPQRDNVMGYGFTGTGTVQDGNIQGKVIVVQAMMDEGTCPWCADWYRSKIIETKGSDRDMRVYYMENCLHGDVALLENNMIVNYLGAHKQALLDLAAWVEGGIEPPESSAYRYEDGQIYLAEGAAERRGVQPVVELFANGSVCSKVKVGEPVTFTAKAVVPKDAGFVTAMDFGFEDKRGIPAENSFPIAGELNRREEDGLPSVQATVTHTYNAPGVYFAAVRVKAERNGDANSIFTQVKNLARARIVVE